jgi:hypothetical protein
LCLRLQYGVYGIKQKQNYRIIAGKNNIITDNHKLSVVI